MKLVSVRQIFLLVIISGFLIGYGIGIAAIPDKDKDEIARIIKEAELSQKEKAELLKQAHGAIDAGISPADITIIIRRGLLKGWNKEAIEESLILVIKAKEQNLPVSSILNRLHQGLAKGIPPQKVFDATKRLVKKLIEADGIVDNLMMNGMKADNDKKRSHAVETVAWALERAIPEDTIMGIGEKLIRNRRPLSTFDAAVATMTIFTEMGMTIEHASRLINSAIDRGYTEKEMVMMERELHNILREGWKIEDAVGKMESLINRGGVSGSWMGGGAGAVGRGGMGGTSGMGGAGMGGRGGMGGRSGR
jgi:hypothetical protein